MPRWSDILRSDDNLRPPASARGRTTTNAEFEVVVQIGPWQIPIPWHALSLEDARASFLEFLEDGDEVRRLDTSQPHGVWRSVDVLFQGQAKQLTFRADWIAGFTVKKA